MNQLPRYLHAAKRACLRRTIRRAFLATLRSRTAFFGSRDLSLGALLRSGLVVSQSRGRQGARGHQRNSYHGRPKPFSPAHGLSLVRDEPQNQTILLTPVSTILFKNLTQSMKIEHVSRE